MSRPTLDLLLDLAARLRLACEALSEPAGAPIEPRHISLDDLAPGERARLRRAARDDLWDLINASAPLPPAMPEPVIDARISARLERARRGGAGAA